MWSPRIPVQLLPLLLQLVTGCAAAGEIHKRLKAKQPSHDIGSHFRSIQRPDGRIHLAGSQLDPGISLRHNNCAMMGVADQKKSRFGCTLRQDGRRTDAYFLRRYSPFGCRDAADAGLRRRAAISDEAP